MSTHLQITIEEVVMKYGDPVVFLKLRQVDERGDVLVEGGPPIGLYVGDSFTLKQEIEWRLTT
jgi:hypothetical protein